MIFVSHTIAASTLDLSPLPGASTNTTDTSQVIQQALPDFFVVMGAVAVFVITVAGFRYVLSHGDPKVIEQSKNAILYAVVGLIVCIAAYSIVNFVLGNF